MGRPSTPTLLAAAALWLVCVASAGAASATDTHEPFSAGVSNFEYYLGMDGYLAGPGSLWVDTVWGAGLSPSLGVYIQAVGVKALSTNETSAAFTSGLAFTRDSAHLDVDVFGAVSFDGPFLDRAHLLLAQELNLDSANDLSGVGVYSRVQADLSVDRRAPSSGSTLSTTVTLGTYLSMTPGTQVLVELDATVAGAAEALAPGGLLIGLNHVLDRRVELQGHVRLVPPWALQHERLHVVLLVGAVVTLERPSA